MDHLINTPAFAWYYFITNIITLLLYALDKVGAVFKWQRISERTLHLSALLSGGLGAIAGQLLFRHKIRKPSFVIIALLSLVAHLTILSIA